MGGAEQQSFGPVTAAFFSFFHIIRSHLGSKTFSIITISAKK